MKKIVHPLLTSKYTEVYHEEPAEMKFGAPHTFSVLDVSDESKPPLVLATIHFQEGPIKESGVNGIANEDALGMVLTRLEHFQKGPYACRENALAITKLEETIMWLRRRTQARVMSGTEGTSKV